MGNLRAMDNRNITEATIHFYTKLHINNFTRKVDFGNAVFAFFVKELVLFFSPFDIKLYSCIQ